MSIHPSAIIDSNASVDPSAEVGPYCIIGPHVRIGARCHLIAHVVVQNHVEIENDNIIHPFACLGGIPQDKKFDGEPGKLLLGAHNTIRESTTVNIGTQGGGLLTKIGSHCLFMAGTHVAHDCILGDHVIMANGSGLAGHVHVADGVTIGGMVGVHQFCRIGRYAFIGAGSMVAFDVPPFCSAQGDRAALAGLNTVGLQRAGWKREQIIRVYRAFCQLFYSHSSREQALSELLQRELTKEVLELCDFIRDSKRGISPARGRGAVRNQSSMIDDAVAHA
jgi:UDP-N-acetylglucosamine acyltransferase